MKDVAVTPQTCPNCGQEATYFICGGCCNYCGESIFEETQETGEEQ